jgi:hypothetical protein
MTAKEEKVISGNVMKNPFEMGPATFTSNIGAINREKK